MSRTQDMLYLIQQYRLPTFREIQQSLQERWQSDSKWFGLSVGAHSLLLLLVAFVPMAKTESQKSEAPEFMSCPIDTVQAETDFTNFELGEAPLEPTELSTESLTAMDAPPIESQAENYSEETPTFDTRGSNESPSELAGIGQLGGVTISVLGDGPISDGRIAQSVSLLPNNGGFAGRGPTKRDVMLAENGGTKNTERAVQGALVWFARHQNADGSWSLNKHVCNDGECTCGGVGDVSSNAAAT